MQINFIIIYRTQSGNHHKKNGRAKPGRYHHFPVAPCASDKSQIALRLCCRLCVLQEVVAHRCVSDVLHCLVAVHVGVVVDRTYRESALTEESLFCLVQSLVTLRTCSSCLCSLDSSVEVRIAVETIVVGV